MCKPAIASCSSVHRPLRPQGKRSFIAFRTKGVHQDSMKNYFRHTCFLFSFFLHFGGTFFGQDSIFVASILVLVGPLIFPALLFTTSNDCYVYTQHWKVKARLGNALTSKSQGKLDHHIKVTTLISFAIMSFPCLTCCLSLRLPFLWLKVRRDCNLVSLLIEVLLFILLSITFTSNCNEIAKRFLNRGVNSHLSWMYKNQMSRHLGLLQHML